GHPQGACGAAGIAATIAAMQSGQNPPTINLKKPDPECDLDYVPEAGRKKEIEQAVCNCIAFGSKNSAVVLRKVARTSSFNHRGHRGHRGVSKTEQTSWTTCTQQLPMAYRSATAILQTECANLRRLSATKRSGR